MIKPMEKNDIEECLEVIHTSFTTVAKEFNLTKENCPGHTSYMPKEKLQQQFTDGRPIFIYAKDKKVIGYFSLGVNKDGSYELDNLAVLPHYRHLGIGKEMVKFAKDEVKRLGSRKITIGIIEENTILRNWYSNLGFKHLGTRKFEQLPFTVGFMEMYV
jgi:diamine N-acetyltransferase